MSSMDYYWESSPSPGLSSGTVMFFFFWSSRLYIWPLYVNLNISRKEVCSFAYTIILCSTMRKCPNSTKKKCWQSKAIIAYFSCIPTFTKGQMNVIFCNHRLETNYYFINTYVNRRPLFTWKYKYLFPLNQLQSIYGRVLSKYTKSIWIFKVYLNLSSLLWKFRRPNRTGRPIINQGPREMSNSQIEKFNPLAGVVFDWILGF